MRTDLLVNFLVREATIKNKINIFEPHFRRNYIHVSDVVDAFIFAIDNFSKMKNNIYNVGLSDANISKKELCSIIQKKISGFVYFEDNIQKDPDQRNYIVSNKKIEKNHHIFKIFEVSRIYYTQNYQFHTSEHFL